MDLNDSPGAGRVPREGAFLARGAQGRGARPARRGRAHRRGRDHRRAPRVAGQARRGRPRRRHVAPGVRRPGDGPDRAGRRQPGDLAGRRPRDPRRDRRRDARPDDHRPRHGGAEGPLPRAAAPRRRGLVPAVLRAGRRVGPRRHPDPRAGRRTTAPGCSTARRCGRPTRSSPPTACCSPAPTPRCPSTRA